MIQFLALKGFQCHKSIKLDLGEITTIVGATDAGKSSILRALRWLCLNQGGDFIQEGAKYAAVMIQLGGNKKIVRRRSKSHNIYAFGEDVFKAFGTSVPDPIKAVLKVDAINFQGQHDPPFWFTQTGGEVSRELNRIIDLSVIDSALGNVASRHRKAQERVGIVQERLDALKGQAAGKDRARIAQFESLAKKRKEWVNINSESENLNNLVERALSINVPLLRRRAEQGVGVLYLAERLFDLDKRIEALLDIIVVYEDLADCQHLPPDLTKLEETFSQWGTYQKSAVILEQLLKHFEILQGRAKESSYCADVLEDKITKLPKCPTCERLL